MTFSEQQAARKEKIAKNQSLEKSKIHFAETLDFDQLFPACEFDPLEIGCALLRANGYVLIARVSGSIIISNSLGEHVGCFDSGAIVD